MQTYKRDVVLVTDSGCGGLNVLLKLYKTFRGGKYFYLSDKANMPYGQKTQEQIKELCIEKIKIAKELKARLIVVACNTMSVVGRELFFNSEIPIVFLQPEKKIEELKNAINKKSNITGSCPNKIALFCTNGTAEWFKFNNLIDNQLEIFPQEKLAADIEKNIFNLDRYSPNIYCLERDDIAHVVLGCTHYIYLKNCFAEKFHNAKIWDLTGDVCEQSGMYLKHFSVFEGDITFIGSGHALYEKFFYNKMYGVGG